MRCPVCRCLLRSGHVCYNCGYRRENEEVKNMSWPDDEYQKRLDALNDVIDEHLDEPSEDDSDEDEYDDEE